MEPKVKVFINHTKGPLLVKDASGSKVKVLLGQTVKLDEAGQKAYAKIEGFVDLSTVAAPSSDDSAELKKENAELKKAHLDLQAQIKGLEEKLAKSEKEKEDLLS